MSSSMMSSGMPSDSETNDSSMVPDNASFCDPDLPEDALDPVSYTDDNPGSPSCSSVSSSIVPCKIGELKPHEYITDEMLAEEKRLHSQSLEKEEQRKHEQELDYQQMAEETREKRFERLKFLLNKSTLYTQYLVERINKQKEEEEKRKERVKKRKAMKEQAQREKENEGIVSPSESTHDTRSGVKRKAEETSDKTSASPNQPKKQKTTPRESPSMVAETDEGGQSDKVEEKPKKPTASPKESPSMIAKTVEDDQPDNIKEEPKKPTASPKESPPMIAKTSDDDQPDKMEEKPADRQDEESPLPSSDDAKPDGADAVEMNLIQKAALFGVEDEDEERYTASGELIPFLQPKLMVGGALRNYQVEGYSWLKVLWENGVNGILADEMGLGKTVQCVAMVAHLVFMGVPGPYLVCAPLSTIPNWFSEFKRFAPQVPTVLYHGTKDKRQDLAKKICRRHKISEGVYVRPVVITSYEIAMIDRRHLGNHAWSYLIVDEGHRIKNTHCRLIRELRMYKSTHRLLLTGTPLQNNLAELWSLLNFLLPEIFDDLGSFEAWFDASSMNDAEEGEKLVQQERSDNVLRMLHQILTPFMLRRLKSDVDLKIPPKKEVLVYAPLTSVQRDVYSALINRSIHPLFKKGNDVVEEKPVELSKTGRPKRKTASRPINYSLLMESEKEEKARKGSAGSVRRWKNLESEEQELESWLEAVEFTQASREEERLSSCNGASGDKTIPLRNTMVQLRKCCNHPYLINHPVDPKTGDLALTEGVRDASGKMILLDHMLPELKRRGHRVLIFSQMTRMLDLIEDYCQLREYDFCRLDGKTKMEDRRDNMSDFNGEGSDKFLFLLSTRAGGLGINLVAADTVIIFDSDWNPQCDLQAQDRCHRIGQTKPVVVYRYVTANTIDQKIIERAAAKRKLEKIVIHRRGFKTGNFTDQAQAISADELQELLQAKDHDSEMMGDKFNISKEEMDMLLDRSDLYKKWGQNQEKAETSTSKSTLLLESTSSRKTRGRKGKQSTSTSATKSKPEKKIKSSLFEIVVNDAESIASCDTDSAADTESIAGSVSL